MGYSVRRLPLKSLSQESLPRVSPKSLSQEKKNRKIKKIKIDMTFALRKQFSRSFKERLWVAQFGVPPCAPHSAPYGAPFRDPYGNLLTFSSATIDHIIPIRFFNTHLTRKENPVAFFDRYKRAANCQDNLQFLDRKTNLLLGSRLEGKLSRHKQTNAELIRYLDYRYSLELGLSS